MAGRQELLAGVFYVLAVRLTELENYKTESAQTLALGSKLVSFQLFNFYLVLMLSSFYGENGGPCVADSAETLLLKQCRELELTGAAAAAPPSPRPAPPPPSRMPPPGPIACTRR